MSATPRKFPEFVIVGAGFSGLMMGLLLERMGAPYTILERLPELKPLGATIALQGNMLAALEQLGFLKDIQDASLLVGENYIYLDSLKKKYTLVWNERKKVTGYDQYVLPRHKLYELMLKRIPAHKILLNKKFVQYEEINDRVIVHCSDGSKYEGDLLISADGVHSKVRYQMYKHLNEINMLPEPDKKPDTINFVWTLAIFTPKDPSKYPLLKEPITHWSAGLGGNYLHWALITLPDNQISWMVGKQIKNLESAKKTDPLIDDRSQKGIEAMLNEFRDITCQLGGTLGEMFDETPMEKISKVFIEETLRETWHHGRVVLTGDAVHKVNPVISQGAMMAMQDVITLSNCIYDMDEASTKNLSKAFESYKAQRIDHIKEMRQLSKDMGGLIFGQTIWQRIRRYLIFKFVPYSAHCKKNEIFESYRPQVNWLPMIESRGTGLLRPQAISRRYKEELEERKDQ